MHFPISFVIKTTNNKQVVLNDLKTYIDERSNGMRVIKERYERAIEEIITINELKVWISELNDSDIDDMIQDINIYYRMEMQIECEEEE